MPAPTTIEVVCDDTEYSRYEYGRDVITATVTATGGATYVAEDIVVDLVKARRNRDSVVATTTITINGADPSVTDVTFALRDIVDSDLISLIRHGKYFVRATSVTDDTIVGESGDVDLRVITVQRVKDDYLFGIDLRATQVLGPLFQPQSITGVTITNTAKTTVPGFITLTYTNDGTTRTLSWGGGPSVTISGPGTYALQQGGTGVLSGIASNNYITVKVGSLSSLPASNVSEQILIQDDFLNDTAIGSYIDRAISWIENEFLQVYIEPTYVVTDRDLTVIQYSYGSSNATGALYAAADYDFITTPLSHLHPGQGWWIKLDTPFKQLLRVDSLFGAIAGTRVIDVNLEWCEISMQGGMVELVPYNQSTAFNYIGLLWQNAMRGGAPLPNFWHYAMVAGLRDTTPDLIELIGKKAALEALVAAGQAYRPGVGSVSLSRDGVSESVSYLQTKYGKYGPSIEAIKDWLKDNAAMYKAKYRGLKITVV